MRRGRAHATQDAKSDGSSQEYTRLTTMMAGIAIASIRAGDPSRRLNALPSPPPSSNVNRMTLSE